ncbi:MAG: hypothetical protein WB382_08730, partial [Pseudolabrys sp.]
GHERSCSTFNPHFDLVAEHQEIDWFRKDSFGAPRDYMIGTSSGGFHFGPNSPAFFIGPDETG